MKMKTLYSTFAILSLTLCAAFAVPSTVTVYRTLAVDANGILVNAGTNLLDANGIARSGTVAGVAANLGIVSNLAVTGISSAAVAQATAEAASVSGQTAQATADAAMATGTAARVVADAALPASWTNSLIATNGYSGDTIAAVQFSDTNTIIMSGSGTIPDGVYTWTGTEYHHTKYSPTIAWGGAYGAWIMTFGAIHYHSDTASVTGGWHGVAYGPPNNTAYPQSPYPTVRYVPKTNSVQSSFLMTVSEAASNRADEAALAIHAANSNNPHGVTYLQAGAMPSNGVLSSVNWIDLIAPGISLAGGAAAPQLIDGGTGTGIQGMGYDLNDIAYGCLQMPHSLALTNASRSTLYISPHVHWSLASAPSAPNTNVTWQLVWEWGNIHGGYDYRGTNSVTIGDASATNLQITGFGNITNHGAGISSIFRFRLGRTTSSANDYGSTRVILDQFDIHVPIDRPGSAQELIQ